MKTSEVLHRAADLIEERGWINGPGWPGTREDGRLCLEGGILAAQQRGWEDGSPNSHFLLKCPAYKAVASYLGVREAIEVGDSAGDRLYNWNDQTGLFGGQWDNRRTAEQVIEVLRATALIEAAKESELPDAELQAVADQLEGADVINGLLVISMGEEDVTFRAHRPQTQAVPVFKVGGAA